MNRVANDDELAALMTTGRIEEWQQAIVERYPPAPKAEATAAGEPGRIIRSTTLPALADELEKKLTKIAEHVDSQGDRLAAVEARPAPPDAEDAEFETLRAKGRAKTLEGAEAKRFYELLETRIDPQAPVNYRTLGKFAEVFGRGVKEKFAELEKRVAAAESKIAALSSNQRRNLQ